MAYGTDTKSGNTDRANHETASSPARGGGPGAARPCATRHVLWHRRPGRAGHRRFADQAHAVGLQSDGKMLVAGRTHSGSGPNHRDAVIVRLLPDGSLDNAFGSGGVVRYTTVNLGCFNPEWFFDLLVLDDDRFLAAGYDQRGCDARTGTFWWCATRPTARSTRCSANTPRFTAIGTKPRPWPCRPTARSSPPGGRRVFQDRMPPRTWPWRAGIRTARWIPASTGRASGCWMSTAIWTGSTLSSCNPTARSCWPARRGSTTRPTGW